MSQLPKEWEAIAGDVIGDVFGVNGQGAGDAIKVAVERCYALTQKPVRELTAAEICLAFDGVTTPYKPSDEWLQKVRAVIAAHQRKQQEPETVTFRAARNRNDHSEIYMAKADSDWSGSNWEWLPGEPQTIEVKLP